MPLERPDTLGAHTYYLLLIIDIQSMKKNLFSWLAILAAAFIARSAAAQETAVKTNLLYDATTTPNIGVEVGIGKKSTVNNIAKGVKDYRYQGSFAGIGATYGYQWILSRHFNIEAEIGVGYNHVWYDKYPCYECGSKIADGGSNYLGITKLGISLLYIF